MLNRFSFVPIIVGLTDMFYGDRGTSVKDPSGNTWFIATHREDVAPQELAKRADVFFKQQKGKAA